MTTGRINQIAIHAARDRMSLPSRAPFQGGHVRPCYRPTWPPCEVCVSLSNFCYQSGSWRRLPSFTRETILTPHATALVPALDAPHTSVKGPPAAAQARALIVDRSLRLRAPQLLYRVTLRTDVYVTSARASRPTPIGSDSEWSLSRGPFVRSLSSPACATFFRRRLPGSQVLRSWLCFLQWFLIENRYNLPIVGTERLGFLTARDTLPFAISSTPLILGARSCGHPPRKHNLKSHLAAHANPALGAQTCPLVWTTAD